MTDRFQLVAQPLHEPGEDIITRTTVGPFVDCGAWLQPSPRRRRILLSVETIRQLAEVAGIVSGAPVSEAAIQRERALAQLDFLKENLGGDLARVLGRLARIVDDAELPADEVVVEGGTDAVGQNG